MYAAILLAAGQSSRMGQPKGLLPWEGVPLLVYQIAQLEKSRIDHIILVLGHQPERYQALVSERTHVVWNEEWKQGKTRSIIKGLTALSPDCEAVLFVNIDQPVSAGSIDRLLAAYEEEEGDIYIPVAGGTRGHPVLFSSRLLPALSAITEEGLGLKGVIRDEQNKIVSVHMSDASVLYNFNTPADYEKGRGI
ncbi:nucleotidyltransferase family protein [Aneurinibacillus sp. REN35]|uniref:nucleotidyltransferase family protein n=1 Tax=Aneurinibacillus sp. REN35 TaxID=3237286 RepID=UPI0035280268